MERDSELPSESKLIFKDITSDGLFAIFVRANLMLDDDTGVLVIYNRLSNQVEYTEPINLSTAITEGQPPTEDDFAAWRALADKYISG